MRFYCRTCEKFSNVLPLIVRVRQKAGLNPICGACGNQLAPAPAESGRTDNQKRSRQQEKRAANRLGGRVQPASGAGRAKGDVRVPGKLRMECKLTRADSYSLKLDLLKKIEAECEGGEYPAFEIEFQGVYPPRRYVVIPGWLYDHYVGLEEK